jgi:RimJ/RimL family protein N-acetyltransferase
MSVTLKAVDTTIPQNAEEVARFISSHYAGAVPVTPQSVQTGNIRLFWAWRGETRIGVTGYLPRTQTLAETVKTVIHPEHRGQGLGAELSRLIEEEVRRAGFKKVMTTIYIDNHAMILIKLRQGYRFEGFHPDHEKPGWHEYSFGKILS